MVNEEWFQRLIAVIDADERKDNAISKAAGLGRNFVSQMRNDGKAPGVSALVKLCDVLGVTTTYILDGIEIDPGQRELLMMLDRLSDNQKQALLDFVGHEEDREHNAKLLPSPAQRDG